MHMSAKNKVQGISGREEGRMRELSDGEKSYGILFSGQDLDDEHINSLPGAE